MGLIKDLIILILRNFNNVPWVGLIVAFSWAFYNVLRKLINVDTDIGLLIESLYILPISLIVFYFIFKNGQNDFSLENLNLIIDDNPVLTIPILRARARRLKRLHDINLIIIDYLLIIYIK